jgi:5-formyltetrahydrofolate cyclo-ligase
LKHEQYKKEQEALQKKINESIQENIQKLRAKKEASYLKLRKEVEVL